MNLRFNAALAVLALLFLMHFVGLVQVGAAYKAAPAAHRTSLPIAVYADGAKSPWIPSGYMGTAAAIKMDPKCKTAPHTGPTCLEVSFTATSGWGGVVWQNPANNWGAVPGGVNVTGAKKLVFWARGATGSEKVSFQFGLIGPDKRYHDTASGKLSDVSLGKQWKQYSFDLKGKDLSNIVTGFAWVVGSGHPMVFYLDDISYR